MGLEAGWNCHISLLSGDTDPTSLHSDLSARPSKCSNKCSAESLQHDNYSSMTARKHTSDNKNRRCSAPGSISLDVVQVKFEPASTIEESLGDGVMMSENHNSPKGNIYHDDFDLDQADIDLLTEESELQVTGHSYHLVDKGFTLDSSKHSSPIKEWPRGTAGHREHVSDPLLEQMHSDLEASPIDLDPSEVTGTGEVFLGSTNQDENLSSSESYPASSYVTENTDSVMGGLGLSNRVSWTPSPVHLAISVFCIKYYMDIQQGKEF